MTRPDTPPALRKRLLEDRTWRYVPAAETNIRTRFDLVRAELAPQSSNVKPLRAAQPITRSKP